MFPVAARFGEQLDQILEHLLGERLRYGKRFDVLRRPLQDAVKQLEMAVVDIQTLALQLPHGFLVAGFLFETPDLQLVVH